MFIIIVISFVGRVFPYSSFVFASRFLMNTSSAKWYCCCSQVHCIKYEYSYSYTVHSVRSRVSKASCPNAKSIVSGRTFCFQICFFIYSFEINKSEIYLFLLLCSPSQKVGTIRFFFYRKVFTNIMCYESWVILKTFLIKRCMSSCQHIVLYIFSCCK